MKLHFHTSKVILLIVVVVSSFDTTAVTMFTGLEQSGLLVLSLDRLETILYFQKYFGYVILSNSYPLGLSKYLSIAFS